MSKFYVQLTDTYGGEANYSWVKRFTVNAKTALGAIRKVTRETGYPARKQWSAGDTTAYKVPNACMVYFVTWTDDPDAYGVEL